jgi:xanthine dehydrogenase accessory factor
LSIADRLLELAHTDERAVLFTVVDGPRRGSKLLVLLERDEVVGEGPAELVRLAPDIRRNHVFEHGAAKIFAEVYGPPPRLVVVGAVDTAEALCAFARGIGWHTICVDARAAFATPERVPSADELVVAWPQDAFATIPLDRDTAVVTLAHDDRFDIPTLAAALRSDAFYVGAIGSRRTQAHRRERLVEAGCTADELERIHGPAGLDVGAETPAETALAILAEALAVRAVRMGVPLHETRHRIHVER